MHSLIYGTFRIKLIIILQLLQHFADKSHCQNRLSYATHP